MKKIIRVTTVPGSLGGLLSGQLKYMSNYYEVVGVSSKGKNDLLYRVGITEGIRVEGIEMTRQITPFKDLCALWKLYLLFKRETPNIVHSHTPKAGTLAMIASWLAKVPHRLHTVAGLPLVEAVGVKRIILNFVEKITYSCATKIYPNSFGLKEFILKEKFTQENKLKVLANGSSNGIDINYFNLNFITNESRKLIKNRLKIMPNDFVFIFVGRIVKDKGVNELIEAFNELNSNFEYTKLLLVGSYENKLDPLLPKTLKLINTNSSIKEIGWVKDVRPYLSISNVMTFPSYREGFPNVVMQASSMELACIVTDINGCNEIIKHNENGLLIPKKDSSALYKAMKFVLLNEGKLKEMALTSRENIVKNYDRKRVWKAIREEYAQLK